MSTDLVVPGTGEIVNLDDAPQCARILGDLKTLKGQIRELEELLKEAIYDESRRQGIKTLHLPGMTAVVTTPVSIIWDHEILAELQEAGLPEERFNQLVKTEISFKVSASVAKQLSASNEAYAEIIARAQTRIEKPSSVTVTPTKGE